MDNPGDPPEDFFPAGTTESPDKFLEFAYTAFINLRPELIFRISNLSRQDQEYIITCFELEKMDKDPRNIRDARWIAEMSLGDKAFNREKINEPWVGRPTDKGTHKTTLRDKIKGSLNRGDEVVFEG